MINFVADPTVRRDSGSLDFPEGRKFAFTILDDTDDATVENVRPVYDLLTELGFRTTKTVWPLACPEGSRKYGAAQTLADAEYLAFVRSLLASGYEIAYHGATMESSTRQRTEEGLRAFSELLGVTPTLYCNHGQNLENIYWGASRYRASVIRLPVAAVERLLRKPRFTGHVPGSRYYWGDICQSQFRFVRNFAFTDLDYSANTPAGPYRLSSTPLVQHWFSTADAPDAADFKRLVTPRTIKQLCADGRACILSTHLGKGYSRNGYVDPAIEDTLRFIASQPGWYRPVSETLEFLLTRQQQDPLLSPLEEMRLETRHIVDRLRDRSARMRGA